MKKILAMIACLSVLAFGSIQTYADDTSAMPTCKDGTMSKKAGKGACSHHGGVQKAGAAAATSMASSSKAAPSTPAAPVATKKEATAASASTTAAADSNAPTAKCKDGTMSHSKHHSGTCSHHGGVAQWL